MATTPTHAPRTPAAAPIIKPTLTLGEVQSQIGGVLSGGDAATVLTGVNGLDEAQPTELSYAQHPKYLAQAKKSRAGAIIVGKDFPELKERAVLRVDNPRLAFVKALYLFQPKVIQPTGVSRHAVVAPDAHLGFGVTILECAVIRPGARIGARTIIESGAHIGEGVTVGEDCRIGPNVVITFGNHVGNRVIMHGGVVIGADGFGFVWNSGHYLKIPHLGNVVIEDDVELGANSCVDRASFGTTFVKKGTKVDNMVQIAHNNVIGEHVVLSGQVGLAGSVKINDRAILGGQVGVVDHVTVGADARVGAASLVTKDVPPGHTIWGMPAREMNKAKREVAAVGMLPRLLKELSATKKRPSKRPASGRSR